MLIDPDSDHPNPLTSESDIKSSLQLIAYEVSIGNDQVDSWLIIYIAIVNKRPYNGVNFRKNALGVFYGFSIFVEGVQIH